MSSGYINIPERGSPSWRSPVATATALPTNGNVNGDARVTLDTDDIYIWNGTMWVLATGAGAGVASLNSLTGAIVLAAGTNVTLGTVGNTITINSTGGGGGSGTVTSVALAEGSSTPIFSISGSPVTTSGTLDFTLKTQSANTVLAGPTTGSAAQPTFRSLVAADLPSLTGTYATITLNNLSLTGYLYSNGSSAATASTTIPYSAITGAPAAITALTGDGTAAGPGSAALTLATVNSNTGSFGSSTAIPSFTVNAKGLITAASTNVVVAPAGTLSGTTLASNVVSSSLTSVGTIASGLWEGSAVTVTYGGTGASSFSANQVIIAGTSSTAALTTVTGGTSGYVLTSNGATSAPTWQAAASGSGTVTSVAMTVPSILSVTPSSITTSGTFAITLATETANTVFAGPTSGGATTPTFRSLVSADIPNNAANTSGSSGSFTGSLVGDITGTQGATVLSATTNSTLTTLSGLTTASSLASIGTITTGVWNGTTIAIAHGGTGQTTAAAAFSALSPVTTTGDLIYSSSGTTNSRLAIGSSGNVLTVVSGVPAWSSAGSGSVTSVALADGSTTPIYTISGSPVTTSGTLTFSLNGQSANHIFAGPTTGTAAVPTFRSLVSADIPNNAANTSGTAAGLSATLVIGSGGTGVTSVTTTPTASAFAGWDANSNLSASNFIDGFTTTATAGTTTTLTVASTEMQYFTGSTTQTVKLPVTGTLIAGQSFTIVNTSSGVVTVETSGTNTIQAMAANTQLVVTCNNAGGSGTASWNWEYTAVNNTLAGTGNGSVTSVAMSVPSFLSVSGTPITTSGTLTVTLSGTALPIANGGTAVTSVTTSPTATAFAGWDANKNLSANNHIAGYRTTATAGTTTTLVVGDAEQQYFTGSTTQTVILPVTSTLVLGQSYTIVNNSSGVVTVESSGTNSIQAMAANTQLVVTVISTSLTTAAAWNATYSPLAGGSGSVSSVAMSVPAFLSVSGSPITSSGTLAVTLSGTALPIANGGTGQTSAAAAYNALSPMTTTGDLEYESGTNTAARLPIGSTGNVLTVVGGVPAWAAAPAASLSYASGYTNGDSPGRTWSTTNSSFATPTISGGSASYTSRVSSGITITQAASNAPGIVFTPSSSTAVYIITCNTSTVLTSGLTGLFAAQLYNSTTSTVLATSPTLQEAANTNMPVFITGIVAPASTSAQTIVLQALTSNASAAAIVGFTQAGGSDVNFEWTVMQIHA